MAKNDASFKLGQNWTFSILAKFLVKIEDFCKIQSKLNIYQNLVKFEDFSNFVQKMKIFQNLIKIENFSKFCKIDEFSNFGKIEEEMWFL